MRKSGRQYLQNHLIGMGRHLVYSEGTKTEPFYVRNISDHIEVDPTHRNILIPKKYKKTKHTIELIRRAEEDVKKERKNGKTIDGVWILFDKDSFDDFDDACSRIECKNIKKNSNGESGDECGTVWHCCYSYESFEVWSYLHYEDLVTQIPRKDYISKINAFIKSKGFDGEYKKNNPKLYDFLISNGGNVKKAIKFAKKKDVGIGKTKTNPSTRIYEFAEFFMAYFKE